MLAAPTLPDDAARLAALERLHVLDSPPERVFDRAVELAAQICVLPTALVTLVDRDRQWFKARLGLALDQTGRRESFCGHAIADAGQVLVVEDAAADARFADNPLVTGEPHIRFYAGAPVVTSDGHALGTVCVIDRRPRRLEPWQLAALSALAGQVARLLELRGLGSEERAQAWAGASSAHGDVRRLAAVAAGGDDLTGFFDAGGICRYVNDRFAAAWAQPRDRLLGRSLAELVGREAFDDTLRPLFEQAIGGSTAGAELPLTLPGLGRRQWLLHLEPARADPHGVVGVVLRCRDVQPFMDRMGELAAVVDQLERRVIAQERLLRMLAHDLREPLNTMRNFTGLALQHADGAELRRWLGFVQGGALRMGEVIDGLMRYVRSSGMPPALQDVDLGAVVASLREDLADLLQREGGRIDAGALPVLRAEPTLLRLLMQNLLANALRYHRPGVPPVVQLASHDAGAHHEVTVCDNGIGLPAAERETVFDLFRRLHAGPGVPGAGLGLSICRRIVEQHGGTIAAEDGPGGVGTCLRVRWPKQPPASPAAEA